jgi:hypothetical protein
MAARLLCTDLSAELVRSSGLEQLIADGWRLREVPFGLWAAVRTNKSYDTRRKNGRSFLECPLSFAELVCDRPFW